MVKQREWNNFSDDCTIIFQKLTENDIKWLLLKSSLADKRYIEIRDRNRNRIESSRIEISKKYTESSESNMTVVESIRIRMKIFLYFWVFDSDYWYFVLMKLIEINVVNAALKTKISFFTKTVSKGRTFEVSYRSTESKKHWVVIF